VRTVPLGDVLLSLESGARPKGGASADSGDIPSLGGEHVSIDGGFDLTNVKRIPRLFFEAMRVGRVVPQDILIVKDGATTGKTSFVRDDFPFAEAAVNEHVFRLRVDTDRAWPGYVFHYLYSPRGQREIQLDFRGATVGGISRDFVSKVIVPLPPIPEQRRIAETLDRGEALRAMRLATLDHLDALTRSIFLDLFGDPEGAGWPMSTVRDVARPGAASIRTGPFGSQLLHSEFVDQGVAVLGIDNVVGNVFRWGERRYISDDKYRQLKRYTVAPGDVLITIMGTCGRCAIVPDDIPMAINTKHLCCITLDRQECLPVFLHSYFLHHPLARRYLERAAKGAIMAGLNMEIIKSTPIPRPPVALQEEFAKRVEVIDHQKALHQASRDKLDVLFESLQSRAFLGEL
jgi:type I restriction enzyme S subunit